MMGARQLAVRQRFACFTLLELLVVCIVTSVLVTLALGRFGALQQVAEEAMAEQVLGALRSGIRIRSAELITSGRWEEFRDLPKTNPFEWLEELPGNYRGELKGSGEAGCWYFDKASGAVFYYVKRADDFQTSDVSSVMRFSVVGLDGAGRLRKTQSFSWVALRPQGEYVWLGRVLR